MNTTCSTTCSNCGRVPSKFYRQIYCGTCYNNLYKSGTITRLSDKQKKIPDKLTSVQEEILIGLLLGDGHISKKLYPGKYSDGRPTSRLDVLRSEKDKEYLLENVESFKEFVTKKAVREQKQSSKSLDKINTARDGIPRIEKTYKGIRFMTRNHHVFGEARLRWYPNGIKIVPKDLTYLSPLTVAIWFADDGMCTKYHDNRLTITFHTNGFTKEDVERLIDILNTQFGCKLYLKFKGTYPTIHGNDQNARILLKAIDSVFPKSMSRKSSVWRDENYGIFSDCAISESKKESSIRRISKLNEFIIHKLNLGCFTFNVKELINWMPELGTNSAAVCIKYFKDYLEELPRQSKFSQAVYRIKSKPDLRCLKNLPNYLKSADLETLYSTK